MIKIEALTLEDAYKDAALKYDCSITELNVEVVQHPSSGFLGFFKKSAIIVAVRKSPQKEEVQEIEPEKEVKKVVEEVKESKPTAKKVKKAPKVKEKPIEKKEEKTHNILNDTIMPQSFVSDQDDEDYELESGLSYTADYDDAFDEREDEAEDSENIKEIAQEVKEEINKLFDLTCFNIDTIEVSVYDNETLLLEFRGDDAALLIGKEGYRYKALSYMLFNWINSKYQVQLRLEIAEFLKNQEESVARYLSTVYENVDRDGRAQTKILDGVLVQIALKELRNRYTDKYVAIRSTRDGLKYIIINEYNNY